MNIQLKQRLFGAIIVLALIVIFVPMLFNKYQKEQAARTRAIPALPTKPDVKPMPSSVASQEAQVEKILSDEASSDNHNNQVPIQANKKASTSPNLAAKTATRATSHVAPPSQIKMNLQSTTNKPIAQKKVTAASQKTVKEKVSVKSHVTKKDQEPPVFSKVKQNTANLTKKEIAELTHYYNNPQATLKTHKKKAAQKVSSLKKTKKFSEPYYVRSNVANSNNVVIAKKHQVIKKEKQALKHAKAYTVGWVIQLGSFENTAYANRLAHKLRQKDFTAFTYKNVDTKGHTNTKVFVGPYVKRDEAKKELQILKSDKFNGFITQFDATNLH